LAGLFFDSRVTPIDPLMSCDGRDGVDASIAGVSGRVNGQPPIVAVGR